MAGRAGRAATALGFLLRVGAFRLDDASKPKPPPVRRRRRGVGLAAAITGVASTTVPTGGGEGARPVTVPVEQVCPSPPGAAGGGENTHPAIALAAPGIVTFISTDDLTAGDGNGRPDVYVCDHGVIEKVSDDLPDRPILGVTAGPAISESGRYVVYVADFPDPADPGSGVPEPELVLEDRQRDETRIIPQPPGVASPPTDVAISPEGGVVVWTQGGDIYAHRPESEAPEPTLVSGDQSGAPAGGGGTASVCESAQSIAFASSSPVIVPADTNGSSDIFVRSGLFTPDPLDDQLLRASVSFTGAETDGPSYQPDVSRDCKRVAFQSFATNVVPDDRNATADVFVRDLPTATTIPVTIHGGAPSGDPSLSADGGRVAFSSAADNLVPGDSNGSDPADATPTNFQVLDREGRTSFATSILSVDGPRVDVGFPESVDLVTRSAASVDAGALIDAQVASVLNADGRSNANPFATLAPTVPDQPPTTDITQRPDLVSAEVVLDDNATPDDPADDFQAGRFCFDEAVAEIPGNPAGTGGNEVGTTAFLVQGYNSAVRIRSVAAKLEQPPPPEPGSPPAPPVVINCVRVRFPPGVDIARFTLAAVVAGAVAGADGRANVKASVPLAGTTLRPQPGDVTGPNLRSARPDAAGNQVTFVFDSIEGANPGGDNPAVRFAFVDARGTVHLGESVVSEDRETATVVVQFPADSSLATARRFVALAGAVRNAGGETNVEQSTDGDVAGPELTSVALVGTTTPPSYDFTFNTDVGQEEMTGFLLYTEDGTGFPASSLARPGPRVVRVSTPALETIASSVVLGVARAGAVHQRLATPDGGEVAGPPNPLGAEPVGRLALGPGTVSDGPDLLGVEFFPEAHSVVYTFDEAVRDVHLSPETPSVAGLLTDVFVAVLETGRIVRASVDERSNEADHSSFAPSLSHDGSFVAFPSLAALALTDIDSLVDVFLRGLRIARIDPATIDFGDVPVGSTAEAEIRVVNIGLGKLRIAAGIEVLGAGVAETEPSEFRVADTDCVRNVLDEGEGCTVVVTFSPTGEGDRSGALDIPHNGIGGGLRATLVQGAGRLTEPAPPAVTASIVLSPAIGSPGAVTMARGAGFPSGPVELRWVQNLGDSDGPRPLSPVKVVVPDATGQFGPTPFLIFRGDVLGVRHLRATGAGGEELATARFLVVPGTAQPAGRDLVPTLARRIPQLLLRR